MKPEVFKFVKYGFNEKTGVLVMDYAVGDLKFQEKLIFPKPFKRLDKNKKQALDKALFNVFLIAGISYYKTYCPKKIDLGEYKLTKEQARFWDKLYTKGLGEFFYKNKIDFRGLIKFPYDKGYKEKPVKIKTSKRSLVPIGGGKDSIVSIEKLREKGEKFDLFCLRSLKVVNEVSKVAEKKLTRVDRILSDSLFELQKRKDVCQGHIPFSAYLAFVTVVASILYDYSNIVLSNEKSSNYGNVSYLGSMINHQWSKSEEFENMFSVYLQKFITSSIKYYSALRKMDELEIAKEFSKYKKYFKVFSSCNKNFQLKRKANKRWCLKCPKCVFTFTMLSAYLPESELNYIFGKDLYEDKKLEPLFDELLGKTKVKPFECVGTPDEMARAMELAEVERKILILGFGREGMSSYKYFRKKNKNQIITVADEKRMNEFDEKYRNILKKDKNLELHLGKNYLKGMDEYDMIIKTPGIKLEGIETSSNLNVFLSEIKGKVIGVTGSKGKSTSASLIYEILKQAGKKVELVGNIGKPALDYLNRDSKDTIFVAEISSYQLDTLNQEKIDIALITSFFPEHLNYHGSLQKYFQAKMNIVRNLKPGGVVVYNKRYSKVKNFIKGAKVKSVGYEGEYEGEVQLLGRQMRENILGCIEVVKLFKIKDEAIKKAVAGFKGLEHRMEYAGKFKGIYFYNDVLSTTPESTMEAIDTLKDRGLETIIVGGYDRGLDYTKLAKKIVQAKIKNVVCWPNTGKKILKEIKKIGEVKEVNLIKVKNMRETIRASYKYTNKNGIVLLSPASSSYDFYKSFQEKGAEFKRMINF